MKTNLISIISFIALVIFPFDASAFEKDGLNYEIDNSGNAIVTSVVDKDIYTCEIKSPVEDGGKEYPVTAIGKNAFYNCDKLYKVVLPNSLVSIGEWAFFGCSELNQISLNNTSITEIGNYAFSLCSSLTSIDLPTSLKTIGRSAFSSSGLTTITIPEAVTTIGNSAFASCGDLAEIKSNNSTFSAPDNCNAIIQGNTLLFGCKNTNNIPNGITTIGDNAFYGCSGLRKVEFLPSTITTIGDWAFFSCDNLYKVILPEGLTKIGGYAFSLCSNLKNIDLPESLISIGRSCFSSSALTAIEIKKNVNSIGESAFASCESLDSIKVTAPDDSRYDSRDNCNAIIQRSTNVLIVGCKKTKIPSSVKEIGANAFYGSAIESIEIPSSVTTIGEWAFFSCGKLTNISLSNNLQYIDKYAFSLCSRLESISFPATLQDIGTNAFSSCKKLTNVWANMQNPQDIQEDVFEISVYNNATLHVPSGTTSHYQNATGWKEFNNIVEFDPSGIATPTIAFQRIYSDNGVLFIESVTDGSCNIYSVSGQLMRRLALKKGTNTICGLSKGIYIVNGQKTMVK